MAVLAVLGLGLPAASPAVGPGVRPRPIGNRAILRYARSRFDRSAMAFRHVVIGTQHGVPVVADFPCSDMCPQETRRIIHYAVDPGPRCAAIGGVTRQILVPMGIAVARRPYCVPRVIADLPDI